MRKIKVSIGFPEAAKPPTLRGFQKDYISMDLENMGGRGFKRIIFWVFSRVYVLQ
jgi:hypothetical protein